MILGISNFRITQDINVISSLKSNKARKMCANFGINDDVSTSTDQNLIENYGYFEKTSDFIFKKQSLCWFVVWKEVVIISELLTGKRKKIKKI